MAVVWAIKENSLASIYANARASNGACKSALSKVARHQGGSPFRGRYQMRKGCSVRRVKISGPATTPVNAPRRAVYQHRKEHVPYIESALLPC